MRTTPKRRRERTEIATALNPSHLPRYLMNDEAATFLRLSPYTLEKYRVTGGGPRFHKLLSRRVTYTLSNLEAWANAHTFETTFDPEYVAHSAAIGAQADSRRRSQSGSVRSQNISASSTLAARRL